MHLNELCKPRAVLIPSAGCGCAGNPRMSLRCGWECCNLLQNGSITRVHDSKTILTSKGGIVVGDGKEKACSVRGGMEKSGPGTP